MENHTTSILGFYNEQIFELMQRLMDEYKDNIVDDIMTAIYIHDERVHKEKERESDLPTQEGEKS